MTVLDFLIVAAFIAYAVGSGLRNRRKASRNLDEYFLANRSLPGWQAGLSMAATQFALGFWGPVARDAGATTTDGPRRLGRALAATQPERHTPSAGNPGRSARNRTSGRRA